MTDISPRLTSLSVFFPAHNEAGNIERVVRSALGVCPALTDEYEVIVVDDGSSDDTASIAQALTEENEHVRLVRHTENRGYGGALKTGMEAARLDYVFFSDGDGQFDLSEIRALTPLLEGADMVIGYRIHRQDPLHRRINARLYHWLIRLMFRVHVRDIDCAFKLFRRSILDAIQLQSEGALISAEFLVRAREAGFKMAEVGVHHYPRLAGTPTGGRISVILRMFVELFRFRTRLTRENRAKQAVRSARG